MANPFETNVEARVTSIFNSELFRIGNTPVNLMTVLTVGVIIVFSYSLSWGLRTALRRALKRRGVGVEKGGVSAAGRFFHYFVVLGGIAVALNTVGIQLQALFAAGAVFAVGIGFAMQNIAQNFVSGVILLFERTIKPGDVIEVGGQIVKVK